jgi:Zn-dependent peptidase ImmA (M78 family)
MSRSTEALVDPALLAWARATSGLSIEEAAGSLQTKPEKVQAWEDGAANPSMAQLRKMATAYKRLLSDFYLPRPPEEAPLPHDFRRLPGEVAFRYSRPLRYQLRLARQRRALALDFAAELDSELPTIHGHLQVDADPERAGGELRRLLGVSLDEQRSWRDPRKAYNAWRLAAERTGILVFQVADVPKTEMLGFTLAERPLPVIGINRKLSPNGRTFTLLHECVHVFLDQSGICDIEEGALRPAEEQRMEVFCNAVAAAALVPRDILLAEPLVRIHPPAPRDWSDDELTSSGRTFGVSNEVILRRLLTMGRTSQAFYVARRAVWDSLIDNAPAPLETDNDIKRNMPVEVLSNLGRPFVRLVLDSYANSYTSLADVTRHLGLRADHVAKVENLLAGR